MSFIYFFFQAEDGIRDLTVTGVQTCALPICDRVVLMARARDLQSGIKLAEVDGVEVPTIYLQIRDRSEERRVGKECRSRWATYHQKKTQQVIAAENSS